MPRGSESDSDPARPSVSVVICAYDPERLGTLAAAIDSVRSQSLAAHEILLVIDHSPELLAECRSRWPEIPALPNQESQGLSGTRNSGIAQSTGEVVAFLDDDAFAAPGWLEHLAAAYEDQAVVGVGGPVRPKWLEGRPSWFPAELDWVVGCTHSGMPRKRSPVRNPVGANMSFRREVLAQVGGFRHELSRVGTNPVGGDETDLCIRIAQRLPKALILFDPAASVDHVVPPARSSFGYFAARCMAEGHSKARLAGLVGSESGLAAERTYVRRTLPLGFMRGILDALRGEPMGAARAMAIAAGLLITTAGYLVGPGLLRRAAYRRRQPVPGTSAERLRVLMVTPRNPLGQGGVERHVMEVSRRLIAAGVKVEVLCAEPGGQAIAEQRRDGVVIRSVRAWPANRDLYLAPGLWRQMAREPWDLVHVQSYHTLVAPLAMLRALTLGIPYVLTFHAGGHSSGLRNRLRHAQRRALGPLLARALRLVALARFEIDSYSRELGVRREKFVLIPNGTDIALAEPPASDGPQGSGLLASIGRLERYKGHQRVIAALPYVLERRPDARLLIVGTGPYEAKLRRQVAQLGVEDQVEFMSIPADDRSGMAALLGRVALVVLLSDFETHPLVALEAAAAGRRVLVADRAGLAEVAEDGLARALSPSENPRVIGEAIVEELSLPGPTRRPALTSWDQCATALLELYRSIVYAD